MSQARETIDLNDTPTKQDLQKIAPPKFQYPNPYALGNTVKKGGDQPKKNVVVKPVVSFAPGKPRYVANPYPYGYVPVAGYPYAQPIVVPHADPIKIVPEEKTVNVPIVHSVPEFHNRQNRELHRHIYGDYPSDNYKVASTRAEPAEPEKPAEKPGKGEVTQAKQAVYKHIVVPHLPYYIVLPFHGHIPSVGHYSWLEDHHRLHDKVWKKTQRKWNRSQRRWWRKTNLKCAKLQPQKA